MSYRKIVDDLMALEDLLSDGLDFDAIIFDCDGTLVEVSSSQYLAVKLMPCIILERLYGVELRPGKEFDDAISLLKMLGGFNNVRDIALTLTYWIFVDLPSIKRVREDLGRINLDEYVALITEDYTKPSYVRESLKMLVNWGLSKLGEYVSRAKLLALIENRAKALGREGELKALRLKLGPRSPHGAGVFPTLFEEVYFGSDEIRRRYGAKPRYVNVPGLVKREKIIVTEESLRVFRENASKGLAIITGRSRRLTEMALKPLLKYFRLDASMFTSDMPADFEKPNPKVLIECQRRLGAQRILYVGDGGEDIFLVKKAARENSRAFFAGVLTNKFSDELFAKLKADIVASDVNSLATLFQ